MTKCRLALDPSLTPALPEGEGATVLREFHCKARGERMSHRMRHPGLRPCPCPLPQLLSESVTCMHGAVVNRGF